MATRPSTPQLVNRLRHLSLSSPPSTALFYARLWHSLSPPNEFDHESLHVLALCFLQDEQPYSALHLVRDTGGTISDDENVGESSRSRRRGCFGCAMVVARCCERLKRFSEGKAVLARAMKRSPSMSRSEFPVDAEF